MTMVGDEPCCDSLEAQEAKHDAAPSEDGRELTIFATPKEFDGLHGIIQLNAIRSWREVHPEAEILVVGDEPGVERVAGGVEARHVADVERNELGTPLVSDMFRQAAQMASNDLLVYSNADMLYLSGLGTAARMAAEEFSSFLLCGYRVDLWVREQVDFSEPDWKASLRRRAEQEGVRHGPTGLDYFVFPRGLFRDLPRFAVGRPGWDNFLVYSARRRSIPVVDATEVVEALHQNHDYSHHPDGRRGVLRGAEARRSRRLAGRGAYYLDLRDTTHRMADDGISERSPWSRPLRSVLTEPLVRWDVRWPIRLARAVARRARMVRNPP